jgi:FAD/FMN-containing dehydrogenase
MDAKDLRSRLTVLLGPDCLLTEESELAPFLADHRKLYRGRTPAVALPRTLDQISRLLAFCNDNRVGIVPHGGNTSYCGGATPDESGDHLLLSLRRLNRIRNMDPINWSMTVEAGCILADAQRAADQADRFFPLSLGSEGTCQIGGNLSTNAGGTNVVRYGMMRDQVLGLEVVLPDGRLLSTLNTLRKDNTGYDLKSLFIGAEGTLGVITAASLKLYPKIRASATAFAAVPSPQAAVTLLSELRDASGDAVSSFELIPRVGIDLTTKHIPGVQDPLDKHYEWYVLCELTSSRYFDTLSHLLEGALESALARGIVVDGVLAQSERHREAFWKLRETIPEAQRIDGASLKHDISVPVAALPEFIERASAWVKNNVPEGRLVAYGHLGDGNLHFNLNQAPGASQDAFMAREPATKRAIHDLVRDFGGSFSAEHGIGRLKVGELEMYAPSVELQLMRVVKNALDPNGIMNPGKVLRSEPR